MIYRACAVVYFCVLLAWTAAAGPFSLGTPTGKFIGRGALDATTASYTGPGDVVSGALGWWGLRGYNTAFSGNVANLCDAATGLVCVDAAWAGSTLTIPTVSGLICGSTISCVVKTLYDQSGGSIGNLTNATLAGMPAFTAGCISARPCITFAAGNILQSSGTITQAQPFTISAVYAAGASDNNTYSIYFSSAHGIIMKTTDTQILFAGSFGANVTIAAGTFHGIQAVFNGSSSDLNVNGSVNTVDPGTGGESAVAVRFSDTAFTGKIMEGGVWAAAFSSGQSTSMNTNQQAYWGF